MKSGYKSMGYAAAVAAWLLAGSVSPANAEEGLIFKEGNISGTARTLAPLLLESKFKTKRLGGILYMDPVRLDSSWQDSHNGMHPAVSLYDVPPFGKINDGDILSIIIYDNKKVSGRAKLDAYTGRIMEIDRMPMDYGKLLEDIVQEKMKLNGNPNKEDDKLHGSEPEEKARLIS